MMKLLEVKTGSRLYGTHLDNSDLDKIQVYVREWRDLFDDKPGKDEIKDLTAYELTEFMRQLVLGDLSCHQVLWTHPEQFTYKNQKFWEIADKKITLISREILQGWINRAEYYFGRAVRLGKLKISEKNAYDFMTFYNYTFKEEGPKPVRECIEDCMLGSSAGFHTRENFDIRRFGLVDIGFIPGFYLVYEDYSNNPNKPLASGFVGDDGEVCTINFEKSLQLSHKGYVYYNERSHARYKRIMAEIKQGSVSRGYASKSMYHAFRYLDCVTNYLKNSDLPTYSTNPGFLKDIRKHNFDLADLTTRFKQWHETAEELMKSYTGQTEVNTDLVKDIIIKVRGPVELSKTPLDASTGFELADPDEPPVHEADDDDEDPTSKAYREFYEGHGV